MRPIRGFLSITIRQKKPHKLIVAAAAASPGQKPFPFAEFSLARPQNRRGFGRQFCAGK
jgi:hypothetical protein